MKPRVLALSIAILAALGGAAYYHFHEDQPAPEAEPVVQKPSAEPGVLRFPTAAPQLSQIQAEVASLAPVPMDDPLAARVAYDENATARLFSPIAGRVVEIRANVGDSVKAGDVLAILDAPELGTAAADLTKARADAEQKKSSLERVRSLVEAEVLPRRELEAAQADWQQARAEAERARLRLGNLAPGGKLAAGSQRFELRAPISGIVATRQINPSMEVRPDLPEPLFVVTDMNKLSVLVDVPERDLPIVTVGKAAQVEVSAYPHRSFEGKVVRVAPTLDPQTRRVQARVAVDNREGLLKPEMYAKVALLADTREELPRVPIGALLVEGVKNYLFVEREPGVFEKRDVSLAVQTRTHAYVWSGVKAGEKVVGVGALLLNAELASSSR
ncbi:efflux RND transporter periplasmic adaptor subunit [Zoogloea dura]|jgi:cobalt-zinc-cadmium efflux system membrane fusion protein|uniref:Efflux RND transporter periplasmic adaptor subunit n=1 Tax=Zoogloea dura TaxID=2728840 RepID=A0A848GGJ9_9RHOO|nr:efflux RND transporter periplasmic adaptor subunit [Zoogloea dura]NML28601.1 efflux RND transporter periplasmic adaptor subunit [Zoogloea dura]